MKLLGNDYSNSQLIVCCILIFVVLLGLFSAYSAINQYNSPTAEVTGTVVYSDVDSSSSRRGGVDHYIDIEYEYLYNGSKYVNDNIKPGSTESSVNKGTAEEFVSNNSEGDSVTVYVNEDDPSSSWLINERPTGNIVNSLLISVVAVLILYLRFVRSSGERDNDSSS